MLTLTAARLGALVGGAVVVETVFALPGLGWLAVAAAVTRDHPVVVGSVVTSTVLVWLANLIAGVVAPVLDPRLRDG